MYPEGAVGRNESANEKLGKMLGESTVYKEVWIPFRQRGFPKIFLSMWITVIVLKVNY